MQRNQNANTASLQLTMQAGMQYPGVALGTHMNGLVGAENLTTEL